MLFQARNRLQSHQANLRKVGIHLETWLDSNFYQFISCNSGILQSNPFTVLGPSKQVLGSKDFSSEEFAEINWTFQTNNKFEISFKTDRWNSTPIYYANSDSGLLSVSNDPLSCALFCSLDSINPQTMFETLLFDHQLGQESLIQGVNRLGNADQLKVGHERGSNISFQIKRGSLPSYEVRNTGIQEHTKNTMESLFDACRGLVDENPLSLVQISGGLDSRLLLASLAKTNLGSIKTGTVPFSAEREVEIGKLVSDKLKAKHTRFNLEPINEFTINKAFLLTGGHASILGAVGNFPMYRYFDSSSNGLLIGGWTGDALIGSYPPNSSAFVSDKHFIVKQSLQSYVTYRSFFAKRIAQIFQSGSSEGVNSLIDQARDRLLHSLISSSGDTATQKISHWAMFVRQAYFSHISPSKFLSNFQEKSPLLNVNYVSHLLQLTPLEILNKNFYRKMIVSYFPEVSRIPTDSNAYISSAPMIPNSFRTKYDILWYLPKVILENLINNRSLNQHSNTNEVEAFAKFKFGDVKNFNISGWYVNVHSLKVDSRDVYLLDHINRIHTLQNYLHSIIA